MPLSQLCRSLGNQFDTEDVNLGSSIELWEDVEEFPVVRPRGGAGQYDIKGLLQRLGDESKRGAVFMTNSKTNPGADVFGLFCCAGSTPGYKLLGVQCKDWSVKDGEDSKDMVVR